MYSRPTILCVAIAMSATCAFGQSPSPKLPDTGPDFVKLASQDGMTEVELGKMAAMKSSNLFENESTDTNPELASFAQSTLPVLREHQQMAQQLTNKVAQLNR